MPEVRYALLVWTAQHRRVERRAHIPDENGHRPSGDIRIGRTRRYKRYVILSAVGAAQVEYESAVKDHDQTEAGNGLATAMKRIGEHTRRRSTTK